ncbi:MAG: hypothetical protein ACJ8LM_16485, partial [Candidatus Udaeobacter sp.]
VRTVVAIYVINLGYGFEATGVPLREYRFVSRMLSAEDGAEIAPVGGGNRFATKWWSGVPIPLPKNYVLGIDVQRADFENPLRPSYLRGEFAPDGWWYYYLYAIAIKVPLGTWLLLALAFATRISRPQMVPLRDELALLFPAAVILVFVSSQTGLSEHVRYALPVFPYVFVWIGAFAARLGRHRPILTGMALFALSWSLASSIWIFPHSLSYFNELVGGPTGGPNHLIHSNIDWGQDLLILERWLDRHSQARPMKVAYFGYFDPRHVGLKFSIPRDLNGGVGQYKSVDTIPPSWYAISVNLVYGLPHFLYAPDGSRMILETNSLAAFQKLKPVSTAGYSIYIYDLAGAK